jgi:hypothetical protein
MHSKAFVHMLCEMLVDLHVWFTGIGLGIAFGIPFLEEATALFKCIAAFGGLIIVALTGYHKWLQIKNERKNNDKGRKR